MHSPTARWDKIWMAKAKANAELTRCFTRNAGVVIVKDNRFEISSGFNGPPMGCRHPEERHPDGKDECPRRYYGYGSGEGLWICPCSHAELSAICIAARLGRSLENSTMYLWTDPPVLPCVMPCGIAIITAGVKELVVETLEEYVPSKMPYATKVLDLFKEADVNIRLPYEANHD